MMEALRQWLLGVVLTAFAAGLARQLAPEGREQGMVRLVGGLLLLLSLLRPLGELPWEGLILEAGNFQGRVEAQQEVYEKDYQAQLSAIIAEQTQAYIWDKAYQLGLDCSVTVTTRIGETGIPLPHQVTITGDYSQALAECIEREVGIPAQQQIWLEGSAWSREKESGS